jgi:hypothetical protein
MGLSIDIAKANKREEAIAQTKYPNVSVRLSSAPTYSSEPYPYRDVTPLIRAASTTPTAHGAAIGAPT